MKPVFQYSDPRNTTKTAYFPSCCPYKSQEINYKTQNSFKKTKKFITLSKNISSLKQKVQHEEDIFQTPKKMKTLLTKTPPQKQFQSDKHSFLQQIRNYNPGSDQKEQQPQQPTFTLQSSKDHNSSGKSNENNLSSLLQSLNNQMFSSLLVSSSIKQKIVVSASLRSIAQVKSELQISQRSQSYRNSLQK